MQSRVAVDPLPAVATDLVVHTGLLVVDTPVTMILRYGFRD
jgi:hypothetical protein